MIAYLLGVATVPALALASAGVALMLTRNLQIECRTCGHLFGVLPSEGRATFNLVTRARYRVHRYVTHRPIKG